MFAVRAERDYCIEEDFMKAARKVCCASGDGKTFAPPPISPRPSPPNTSFPKVAENKKLESNLEYKKV